MLLRTWIALETSRLRNRKSWSARLRIHWSQGHQGYCHFLSCEQGQTLMSHQNPRSRVACQIHRGPKRGLHLDSLSLQIDLTLLRHHRAVRVSQRADHPRQRFERASLRSNQVFHGGSLLSSRISGSPNCGGAWLQLVWMPPRRRLFLIGRAHVAEIQRCRSRRRLCLPGSQSCAPADPSRGKRAVAGRCCCSGSGWRPRLAWQWQQP